MMRRGCLLTAFLDAAFIGNDTIPDSLRTCEPEGAEGATDEFLAVAAFRVLGAVVQGDTAEVAAVVTSVAYITPSLHVTDRYAAEQRIRVDTLHWTMVQNGSPPQWRVCRWSHEGFDLVTHGHTPLLWSPTGASWSTAIALADSIRRADSEPASPRERRLK
jgi:hypothetical protein